MGFLLIPGNRYFNITHIYHAIHVYIKIKGDGNNLPYSLFS